MVNPASGYAETEARVSRIGVGVGLLVAAVGMVFSASSVQPLTRPRDVSALAPLACWWVAAFLLVWLVLSLGLWMVLLGRQGGPSRWARLITVPGSRKLAEGLLATGVLAGASACAPGVSEVAAPQIEVLRPAESATVSTLADSQTLPAFELPPIDLPPIDLDSTSTSVGVGSLDDARVVVDTATLGVDAVDAEPDRYDPFSPGGSELAPSLSPSVQSPVEEPAGDGGAGQQYVIVAGDNFWAIAESRLSHHLGRAAGPGEITPYWVELVKANERSIQSGNPDLVFPGEVIVLPPLR